MEHPVSDVFDERIAKNTNICSGCFRRVAVERDVPLPHKRSLQLWVSDTESYETEDGEREYPTIGRESRRGQSRMVCQTCGHVGPMNRWNLADDRTLSTAEHHTLGARVLRRLDEQGFRTDADAYHTFVDKAKQSDALQARDYEIITTAANFAIRQARKDGRGAPHTERDGDVGDGPSDGRATV